MSKNVHTERSYSSGDLKDPEITIGIFSHTKPTAKKFYLLTRQCQESFAFSWG
jgi:hypothetical protein